jgi:hypothetical protein
MAKDVNSSMVERLVEVLKGAGQEGVDFKKLPELVAMRAFNLDRRIKAQIKKHGAGRIVQHPKKRHYWHADHAPKEFTA